MAITHEAFTLHAQLPVFCRIRLEVPLLRRVIILRVLVPDQLRVIHFPRQNELVHQAISILAYSVLRLRCVLYFLFIQQFSVVG